MDISNAIFVQFQKLWKLKPNCTIEYNKIFILTSSTFTLGSHNANFAMIIMTFACHHIDISTVACDSHCNVMPFLVVIMPIYAKFYHQTLHMNWL